MAIPAASGRRDAAKEQEHDQHHQHDRKTEREVHFGETGPDRLRAVGHDDDVEICGQPLLQFRQQGADAIRRLDDIRIGRARDLHDERWPVVETPADLALR